MIFKRDYNVLIETEGDQHRATIAEIPKLTVTAPTMEEAVEKLRSMIQDLLSTPDVHEKLYRKIQVDLEELSKL